MVLDMTLAKDRVRLRIADTQDVPLLSDAVIEYYLAKNNNNEDATTKETSTVILGLLARDSGYYKVDVLISDGKNAYTNYKDFLLSVIANPILSLGRINVYAGGISVQDMEDNLANLDNNVRPSFSPEAQSPTWSF